ncbi:MAG: hypothetical protein ACP5N9_04325 [Candidatus Bilamarchaeum sp.]
MKSEYDYVMENKCPKCFSELHHYRGCAGCKKCGFELCEDIETPPKD